MNHHPPVPGEGAHGRPRGGHGPEYLPLPQADLRPLEDVLAVLNVREVSPGRFAAESLPGPFDRLYGGQVMAQCLVAAARTLPGGEARHPNSLHCYFLRLGRSGRPIDISVEVLHDGNSFSSRRVLASQDGTAILNFMASYQKDQPGRDFTVTAPEAPDPDSLPSNSELLKGIEHPARWMIVQTGAFDVRHVDGQIFFPNGAPISNRQMVWIRARTPLPDRTSQLVHRALLAYSCDQVALEPTLRVHGLRWATPDAVMVSLDHAMWFHRHVDVRDWHLYVQEAASTQGGRGLANSRVFSRDGELVASIAQEGVIRVPDDREDPGAPAPTTPAG